LFPNGGRVQCAGNVIRLIAAQNLPHRRRPKNIYVRTGRLSMFFAFHLKPSTVNANGDAGVTVGLWRG
jgi:hypothetical protein